MHNNTQQTLPTPTVKRRLISMFYEAFLLGAVEMLAIFLYLVATGNKQEPVFQHGRTVVVVMVAAAYFIHFWRDSGHTLAMKTWRIKLVQPGAPKLSWKVAIIRYVVAWGWFAPALVVCLAFNIHDIAQAFAIIAVGIVAWAMTAFLDKDRQFLHDKLAGTRLISLPKPGHPGA